MRTRESYDRWDGNHPFCDSSHPVALKMIASLEKDPIATKRLDLASCNSERRKLAYLLYSLQHGQEYNAGNAILWASQSGSLCEDSIILIANIFISKEAVFSSKIGQILIVKIARSLGVHLCDIGQLDLGLSIFRIAIENTLLMNYGRKQALIDWQHFKDVVQQLPVCFVEAMQSLSL